MTHSTLDLIDEQIVSRHLLTHPFYQAWQAGDLSPEALRDYAAQYYNHVAAFPMYLSALHSHTADAATRRALLQNLVDEEAGHPNHPELWREFAAGVGASDMPVMATEAQPETKALVAVFDDICRNGSVAAGLAALYSYESQIPAVAKTKIDGLQRFYGVTSEEALAYFRVHQEADVEHAAAERQMLLFHLNDADASDAPMASRRALEALWDLLSGVCHRHGIVC